MGTHRGAYGFRVTGIPGAAELLVEAPPAWPDLHLRVGPVDGCGAPEHVSPEGALLRLKTGGCLVVDAATRTAELRVSRELSSHELAHPFLGPAAAIAAHWEGHIAFHAGAIAIDDGVWGVVGERERGKSSLMAFLAARGHDIVADDVLVLRRDGTAFAGPRSIDLREEAAERLGVGAAIGIAGARPRWRVALPPVAQELPFRGWVFLAWGDAPALVPLAPSDCLPQLMRSLTLRITTSDPGAMLAWASLPAHAFVRPREWATMEAGADVLVAALRRLSRRSSAA